MVRLARWLNRSLTTAQFDVRAGQIICWSSSIILLVLGMGKLCRLPLSEAELFFGVLLVMAVTLLGVLMGLVLPLSCERTPRDRSS